MVRRSHRRPLVAFVAGIGRDIGSKRRETDTEPRVRVEKENFTSGRESEKMARAAREELVSLKRGEKEEEEEIIDSFIFVCVCVCVSVFVRVDLNC